jgi:hypothetical protein
VDILAASTAALAGDDQTYTTVERQITALTAERDAIASQIRQVLDDAEFGGKRIDEHRARSLMSQAEHLLTEVRSLAGVPNRGPDDGQEE